MNFKKQLVLVMLVSLISCSMVASLPVIAFASDSFAQKTGDEYIWEVTTYVEGASVVGPLKGLGNQLKAVIVKANTTYIGPGHWWDCLWVAFYTNTLANPEWTLLSPTRLFFRYNNSLGYFQDFDPLFIPRNETAVFQFYNKSYGPPHINWTSGPHGYDGTLEIYEGNGTGSPDESRTRYQFNSAGVAINLELYNGTGSGWDFMFRMELQENPIPGFLFNAVIASFSSLVAIYAVARQIRRKIPL